jgi:ketol-acid reductoisomerase
MLPPEIRGRLRAALEEIRSGRFAEEWSEEQEGGYPDFQELRLFAREVMPRFR